MRYFLMAAICLAYLLACTPAAYIHTGNDVKRMKSIVYMDDGTEKRGLLSINFETYKPGVYFPNLYEIDFIAEGSMTSQVLDIKDIKSYVVDGNTYVPKIIDLYLTGENHCLFVKRLTDGQSKMQLYELYQTHKSNDSGEEASYFFISFPSFAKYQAIDINSNKLVPEFENKMSAYVTDCPVLHDKILNKDKAYHYSFVSFSYKKLEVIQRIVKEYNNCK